MRLFIIALLIFYTTIASGQPTTIDDVSNASTVKPLITGNHLIATLETDRQTAYVNEQILLTLQVSAPSTAFNITGDTPALPNVELLPANRQESTFDINGTPHQSIKTVFAVFAKEPGTLQIPSLSFKAVLPVSAGLQNAGKGNPTLTASTQPLQLSIESAPSVKPAWLPAQNLEVSSGWSHDENASKSIHAGEPLTRNITIRVSGQHPGAIAPLSTASPQGIRTYPEPARIETDVAVTGINGTYTQSYAVVASNAGEFILPAIDIEWWDINARAWRTTSLPSEPLRVTEAATVDESARPFQKKHYQYALACLSATVLILTGACIMLWRRNKQLTLAPGSTKQHPAITERVAWSNLQRDIRSSNVLAIRQSMLTWGKTRWPDRNIHRLEQLCSHNSVLQSIVGVMNERLYAQRSTTMPDLDTLKQELRTVRNAERKCKKSEHRLSELYPES